MKILNCAVPVFTIFFTVLTGCATIVGDSTQLVPIKSTPDGAIVTITDEKDSRVFKGITPTSVTLNKSDGSYWGGKSYKVVISKEGYATYEFPIKASANGWYIGGNLVFGGLIGWFIVDPMNGNMYTLSVKEINASLASSSILGSLDSSENVSVVLLSDVPAEFRSKMVKLN